MKTKLLVPSLLSIGLGSVCAQTVERDYAQYLRPLVFLLPDAPLPGEAGQVQKYAVKLDIQPNGAVRLPVSVDPPEDLMVRNINDAARFWLFPPGLTDDCKPGPRSGRVSLEYDTGKGRAWIELAAVPEPPMNRSYTFINRGDDINFPREEERKGINKGKVTIAMKLMADGSTTDHVVYVAVPPSKGFMTNALRGARQIAVKFTEPLDKPSLCTLITYEFKMVD